MKPLLPPFDDLRVLLVWLEKELAAELDDPVAPELDLATLLGGSHRENLQGEIQATLQAMILQADMAEQLLLVENKGLDPRNRRVREAAEEAYDRAEAFFKRTKEEPGEAHNVIRMMDILTKDIEQTMEVRAAPHSVIDALRGR